MVQLQNNSHQEHETSFIYFRELAVNARKSWQAARDCEGEHGNEAGVLHGIIGLVSGSLTRKSDGVKSVPRQRKVREFSDDDSMTANATLARRHRIFVFHRIPPVRPTRLAAPSAQHARADRVWVRKRRRGRKGAGA